MWTPKRPSDESLLEGVAAGITAGLLFAAMQILVAAVRGFPPLLPVRCAASVAMGVSGLSAGTGTVLVIGSMVHLALSGVYGGIYALLTPSRPRRGSVEHSTELLRGGAFAVAVWFVNFAVMAPALYPWFVRGPWQLLLHIVFFGLPLGHLAAVSRRRLRYPEEEPEFAHHGAPPNYRES